MDRETRKRVRIVFTATPSSYSPLSRVKLDSSIPIVAQARPTALIDETKIESAAILFHGAQHAPTGSGHIGEEPEGGQGHGPLQVLFAGATEYDETRTFVERQRTPCCARLEADQKEFALHRLTGGDLKFGRAVHVEGECGTLISSHNRRTQQEAVPAPQKTFRHRIGNQSAESVTIRSSSGLLTSTTTIRGPDGKQRPKATSADACFRLNFAMIRLDEAVSGYRKYRGASVSRSLRRARRPQRLPREQQVKALREVGRQPSVRGSAISADGVRSGTRRPALPSNRQ